MSQKAYTFKATEGQEKYIEREAKRINESASVVLRELVEKGRNEKEMNEQLEEMKKLTIEQQGLFQTQIEYLTATATALRFEVKTLYVVKYGKERAKEIESIANKKGKEKLLEIKS